MPFSLLPYGGHLTVLTISCLVAVAFSHPVKDHNTRPLHMDDIGAYFRIIVEEIEFVQSNLSLEVSDMHALSNLLRCECQKCSHIAVDSE